MEKSSDLTLGYTDPAINQLLKNPGTPLPGTPVGHFSLEEDFFLEFPQEFTIPSFPIHHDFGRLKPSSEYLKALKEFLAQLVTLIPAAFSQLTWFFDPRDTLHPCFFQILTLGEKKFVYVLRLDLTGKPRAYRTITPGTNDHTPVFASKQLYLDSEVLPLESLTVGPRQEKYLTYRKYFEQTWRGESGRGYFITGHWIDQEISKFISRIFLPRGKKTHPYYPLRCRFNTLGFWVVRLSLEGRKQGLFLLNQVLDFLGPQAELVPSILKDQLFSEDISQFSALRSKAPPELAAKIAKYEIDSYLNKDEQKEYLYHGELV